jgi:hypothetical protein
MNVVAKEWPGLKKNAPERPPRKGIHLDSLLVEDGRPLMKGGVGKHASGFAFTLK